jgi:predicted metal-dependent hydrolase
MSKKPDWQVKIIRSDKRRKTVSAKLEGDVLVIRAPAGISDTELAPMIDSLKKRLARREAKRKAPHTDADLQKQAQIFNMQYFDSKLKWRSIRYVTNQNKRFGSCTPSTGDIRLSVRLAEMPAFVRDYVIIHELAHLVEANHGKNFWRLVNRYPLTERARGYLMAVGLENLDDVSS